MPCGWEGYCRSGVVLAVRSKPVVYPLTGLRRDEHPTYTPLGGSAHFAYCTYAEKKKNNSTIRNILRAALA